MKLALIPPDNLAETMQFSHYQLLLPQWLLGEHKNYERWARQRRDNGDFIILDNGEAEGKFFKPSRLLEIAEEFGASELVVPDALDNAKLTRERAEKFMASVSGNNSIRFAGVIQGRTHDECREMLQFYTDMGGFSTIMLPRILLRAFGPKARWMLTLQIPIEFDVHWLGTQPGMLAELQDIPDVVKQRVRGVDTSAPFNYAYANVSVEDLDTLVHRPGGYDKLTFNTRQAWLTGANINTLQNWLK